MFLPKHSLLKAMTEELKIKRVHEEEDAANRTLDKQTQHEKARSDYKDQLERKRMTDQVFFVAAWLFTLAYLLAFSDQCPATLAAGRKTETGRIVEETRRNKTKNVGIRGRIASTNRNGPC